MLRLAHTEIADDGLKDLEALTGLKELDIGRTLVSDGGLARLRQALPDARISDP